MTNENINWKEFEKKRDETCSKEIDQIDGRMSKIGSKSWPFINTINRHAFVFILMRYVQRNKSNEKKGKAGRGSEH